MFVVIRADASVDIGFGHVFRCLTLAEALHARGHKIEFVCRDLPGQLAGKIFDEGFVCHLIQADSWSMDAEKTRELFLEEVPDWIVVDHYGLDSRWHLSVQEVTRKIMVIDDLANRKIDCDLLLDTGIGKSRGDYLELIPANCQTLTGVEFALIRSEFQANRLTAKQKRSEQHGVDKIMINLGGMDQNNLIPTILNGLAGFLERLKFDIIVSSVTPNFSQIKEVVEHCTSCRLLLDVDNMADIILEADFAIGAGGVTAYERCILGLPSIVIPVADNQQQFVSELAMRSAIFKVTSSENMVADIQQILARCLAEPDTLKNISQSCFDLLDGLGSVRVVQKMESMV